MIEQLCSPALLYIAFSLTQIIIDIFKNLYNTAFLKFIVMIIFTILLNILCERGLGVISWLIVFIPFITMTIITSLLLFVFGLSPSSGSLKYNVTDYPSQRELSTTNTNNNNTNKTTTTSQNVVDTYPTPQSYPAAHPYPQLPVVTSGKNIEPFSDYKRKGCSEGIDSIKPPQNQPVVPPIQVIGVSTYQRNT